MRRRLKVALVALTLMLGMAGAASADDVPGANERTFGCDASWCHM